MSLISERGSNYRYEMFSAEGNDACEAIVVEIIAKVEAGELSRRDLPAAVRKACNEVEKTHPEIYDTEPQYQIASELTTRVCEPQMWAEIDRWEW